MLGEGFVILGRVKGCLLGQVVLIFHIGMLIFNLSVRFREI